MKRFLIPAAVFLALAIPAQMASAGERICQSGTDGTTTPECYAHLQKIADNNDDLALCNRQLVAEYSGDTGFGAGKWNRYIRKQNECIKINEAGLKLLKDAYVPGGDTSVRRLLSKNIKIMKANVAKAEADMKKASE